MKGTFVLLLCVLSSFPRYVYSKDGAVHVEGRFLCNGVPVKNLALKIYDRNKIARDDVWNADSTDSNGFFSFSAYGSAFWFFTPDPYLYAEHTCNVPVWKDCYKILRIYISPVLVTEGKFPTASLRIGDFELGDDYENGQQWLDGFKDFNFGGKMRCV